ncbi:MAG: ATP-binding protein [Proteobacteria bacterium]|nr:ATP-binding protein [Pseudomonadota bacterium]
MSSDGGAVATYGFRRQFLATAEEILTLICSVDGAHGEVAVVIEPTRGQLVGADVADDDVVDYAIERNGAIVRRVQVKSAQVPSGMNPLRYSDAAAIFKRLGSGAHDAVILTNKPLAKKVKLACTTASDAPGGRGVMYTVTATAITAGQEHPARVIIHDERSAEELKQSVVDLVRRIRRDNATALGERSAAMITSMLLDRMFEAAADLTPRRFTAAEIVELICTPENQIAHARREHDWGVPLIEVPRLPSAVARTPVLTTLAELFDESTAGRNPIVAVLSGTTGFGKTTIAADFCHLSRNLYEHVVWIDAGSPELIRALIKDRLVQMGIDDVESRPDLGAAFRAEMARIGGPWIVVFDGARRRQDIEPFLPTSGTGFVVVTTTNSTGWWHTARTITVDSFTQAEAVACFEAYAGIEPGAHSTVIADIVARLGYVPLAIAMAASYFRNAGEDVTALSQQYFAGLAALDDTASVPDDFDDTAFAAVRFAVQQMGAEIYGSTELRRETKLLVYHSAFFAPELIPVNLLLQTVQGGPYVELDLTSPPKPREGDPHVLNRILTSIRTQTIARRRRYLDTNGAANPASDTINVHPLVHEILRSIHLQAAPHDASIMNLLAMFMGHLYGWLITLRPAGQFFAVEQLLIHAQWLLDFIDDTITIPDNADDHDVYTFRVATFYLRCELANCYSSRGEYDRGITLLEIALDEFADVEATVHPQAAAAKAAADAIADIEAGGLGEHRALPFAHRAIQSLTKLETFTDQPRRGEVIYPIAAQAAQAINRFGTPAAHQLAENLAAIAGRQHLSQPANDTINQIDRLLRTGRHQQALTLSQRARAVNTSAYQDVMFDNFDTIAHLHLGNFNAAATSLQRILDAAHATPHMRPQVELAAEEIGAALATTRAAWSPRSPRLTEQDIQLRALRRNPPP